MLRTSSKQGCLASSFGNLRSLQFDVANRLNLLSFGRFHQNLRPMDGSCGTASQQTFDANQ